MNDYTLLAKRPVGTVSDKEVHKVVGFMNQLLANEFTLFTKTLNYHWNVTGPRFHSLHNFLETQYREILESMDNIAERVRTLGEFPDGTVKHFHELNQIKEKDVTNLSAHEMIYDLFSAHQKIQDEIKDILSVEGAFKRDPGSEDFLVSLLQKHEASSWMLKSHLE